MKDIKPPNHIKDGIDFYCLWGLWDAPKSPMWNNRIQYEIPNLYIELLMSTLPMPTLLPGVRSRMVPMPLSLNPLWTNWPMRQGRIPWSFACRA